jgi:hypothetical protein
MKYVVLRLLLCTALCAVAARAASDAVLIVVVNGKVTDTATALATVCKAMSLSDCSRLHLSSLTYQGDATTLRITVATGAPKASVVAQQASELPDKTLNPVNIASISKEEIASSAPQLSQNDKLTYVGAGCGVVGILLGLIVYAVCRSRRKNAEVEAKGDAARHQPALPKARVDFTAVDESQRLWQRLRTLEDQTELLLACRESDARQHDLLDEAIELETGRAEPRPVALPTTAAADADGTDWWNRSAAEALGATGQVPQYRGLTSTTRGTLIPDLMNARLAERIDIAANAKHWTVLNEPPSIAARIVPLLCRARSNLHGMGVFANRYIDTGVVLFPYLNPVFATDARLRHSTSEMQQTYGVGWRRRMGFVASYYGDDAEESAVHVVAEDPAARGWGCIVNSATHTELESNCELMWTEQGVPWVRAATMIPPLAELLLDYDYGRPVQ